MQSQFSAGQIEELGSWRLWRHLLGCRLLETASSQVQIAPEDYQKAWEEFCRRHSLDAGGARVSPPEMLGVPGDSLRSVVERDLRLSRWKELTFATEAREHFARRKPDLDRVVYSLLRLQDIGTARELWFRLSEGEASFADLAPLYSSGDETYTAGIVGPVALGTLHPALAKVLRSATPGVLLSPLPVADWYIVARVEHHLPAELDEQTRLRMIEELAARWMNEKLNGLADS